MLYDIEYSIYYDCKYIALKNEKSLEYLYNLDYRQFIDSHVDHNLKIDLKLKNESNINIISYLKSIYELNITNCDKLANVNNINSLIILRINNCNNLNNIYNIRDLNSLSLTNCKNIKNINFYSLITMTITYCKNIIDVSLLYSLEFIIIHIKNDCNVYGFHLLKKITELRTCYYREIKSNFKFNKLAKYKKINNFKIDDDSYDRYILFVKK